MNPALPARPNAIAIFDIGKTNIKLTLVDDHGHELHLRRRPNAPRHDGPYPHHDVEAIEAWLLATLAELAALADIRAIVPVTHGATGALVDAHGLVLPIPDYEHDFSLPVGSTPYAALRPPFEQTCSPALGLGLNLGRQIHWQQQCFPQAFARARHLLMYPQYWAWRLCGVAASEVTSLGCHTDLWQPAAGQASSLPAACDWSGLLPPVHPAWGRLGTLRPALAAVTGLPADCEILCGIHDSNASLLRYLVAERGGPRIVLSTGTWVIAAALDGDIGHLQEQGDMLANVDVDGRPVACMRFMGGREFGLLAGAEALALLQQGPAQAPCTLAELQALVDDGILALPCFSGCGGPFAERTAEVIGTRPSSASGGYALAALYCVLMVDYCLERLDAPGDVVVEGSFTANPYFGALLAQLSGRRVYCSEDSSGTTTGGWLLRHWPHADGRALPAPQQLAPSSLRGWHAYRDQWRCLLAEAASVAVAPVLMQADAS